MTMILHQYQPHLMHERPNWMLSDAEEGLRQHHFVGGWWHWSRLEMGQEFR
jgi:hypothetical protein